MKHLGDITKINGAEAPTVEVIIGGSPCQDLSVAGKRAGLSGERSGKTSPARSVVTKARTSESSSKRRQESPTRPPLYLDLRKASGLMSEPLWEMGGPLLGEYSMHSFGECPREDVESHLSQILEENAHPKYYLSAKACQGILRRAENRGKELPPMLKMALIAQSASKNELESLGG